MDGKPEKPGRPAGAERQKERQDRLGEALRANLRRRKAQARGRADATSGEERERGEPSQE